MSLLVLDIFDCGNSFIQLAHRVSNSSEFKLSYAYEHVQDAFGTEDAVEPWQRTKSRMRLSAFCSILAIGPCAFTSLLADHVPTARTGLSSALLLALPG